MIKMKKIVFSIIVCSLLAFTVQEEYVKTKIGSGISIEMPKAFSKMDEASIIKRYGMHQIPLAIYTDGTGLTSLSVNQRTDSLYNSTKIKYKGSNMETAKKDLNLEKSFLKSTYLRLYEDVEFIQDTLVLINDKDFVVFEFEGNLRGMDAKGNATFTKNYNYIQYGFEKNRTTIFNFNCPHDEKGRWQPVARYIMSTAKI